VLEAARVAEVDVVVNVSTDKAANPICTLGESKRVAERITAHFARTCDRPRYVSVRFGNVLGSRGSVLTVFEKQIAEGGPVTVTDPEVSRFFMTIPEACQLVLQAAVTGDSEIVYTGLREGEKMAIGHAESSKGGRGGGAVSESSPWRLGSNRQTRSAEVQS